MNLNLVLENIKKELKDVPSKEKEKIIYFLKKEILRSLKIHGEKQTLKKLKKDSNFGKRLNNYYKTLVLQKNNDKNLFISPTLVRKKNILNELKFMISADLMLPMSYTKMWVFLITIPLIIGIFFYLIYNMGLINFFILLLPAYVSGPFALLIARISFIKKINKPIDMNRELGDKKRIFGRSKTVIGFVSGIFGAILLSIILFVFFGSQNFSSFNGSIKIGFFLGFGAMMGDLIKSFFKRRLGIESGENWLPFDQIDFLIGAILFLSIFEVVPLTFILIIFPLTILLHWFTNILAFFFRVKKVPW